MEGARCAPHKIICPYLKNDYDLHQLIIRYCSKCIESDIEGFLTMFTESAESRIKIFFKSMLAAYRIGISNGWMELLIKLTHREYRHGAYTTLKTIDTILPE